MNILVLDEQKTYGELFKSILTGQKHRVSLSQTLENAQLKLNTALFDLVIASPSEMTHSLFQYLQQESPYVPLVLMGADPAIEAASDQIVRRVDRPIRIADLTRTLHEAELLCQKKFGFMNKKLNIPLEIQCNGSGIQGQAIGVSMKGILLGNPDRGSHTFEDFFRQNQTVTLETRLPVGENQVLAVPSRILFTEQTVTDRILNVGLTFDLSDTDEKKKLLEWIGI